MLLFACDLDNTLVYSHRLMGPEGAVAVDHYDGAACCYMTAEAHERLAAVARAARFVPVTTRSIDQYRRMSLRVGDPPRYALVCNGGVLLRNGKPDPDWLAQSRELARSPTGLFDRIVRVLYEDKQLTRAPEVVDGLFVFAKSAQARRTRERVGAELRGDPRIVLSVQGSKFYAFPAPINKGTAVRRLRERFGAERLVVAGDGELDLPMLREADIGFVPGDFPTAALPAGVRVLGGQRLRFADRLLEEVQALLGEAGAGPVE